MSSNPIQSFADRLRNGPAAFAAWSGSIDASNVENMLLEGYDCAILDWQHGFHDFNAVRALIATAQTRNAGTLVRLAVGQFAEAARFLDWGATGVIAPMINSVADAKLFAETVKYPPMGSRSWGPARALGVSGLSPVEYLRTANHFSLAIAMIETRAALESLDAILDVEGIDGVLVGPSDLSIALTNGSTVDAGHPEVDRALTRVVEAARKRGKLACAFCMDGTRAGELAARGYHLLSIGNDTILLRMAARQELAKAQSGRNAEAVDLDGADGY